MSKMLVLQVHVKTGQSAMQSARPGINVSVRRAGLVNTVTLILMNVQTTPVKMAASVLIKSVTLNATAKLDGEAKLVN